MAESPEKKAVYFGSLTVEGVKCFKGKETLDLTDEDGKPAKLTVILGNNGTGKTTLLTCLLGMMPELRDISLASDGNVASSKEVTIKEAYPLRIGNIMNRFLGVTSASFVDEAGEIESLLFDGMSVVESNGLDQFAFSYVLSPSYYSNFLFLAYGADRKPQNGWKPENQPIVPSFFRSGQMIDVEELVLKLDYGREKLDKPSIRYFDLIESVVKAILQDVKGLIGKPDTLKGNHIEVATEDGLFDFKDLSLGYQVMLTLIVDIAWMMILSKPISSTPFNEPAVILIDEIDLHLHPSWQQRILNDLTTHFPNVQFIVTTHSPLVLQSAKKVNLAVLHSTENGVTIKNYKDTTFSGWSPEEILHDLMELDHTHSDLYGELMRKFKDAVIEDRYLEAKVLFDQLDKILHPNNVTRRLLKLDLASLTPPEVA